MGKIKLFFNHLKVKVSTPIKLFFPGVGKCVIKSKCPYKLFGKCFTNSFSGYSGEYYQTYKDDATCVVNERIAHESKRRTC